MALTLRQIDAFRAVMVTGTLTEAAVHLGISQPAISRLIADMETEIGYRLFERIGRRVTPTGEAAILIEEVKRALVGLDQIREAALEIGRFRYARLRLLTVPTIASAVTTDLIKAFSACHPDTFISLEVRPEEAAVDWLVTQQCDLGIVTGIPEAAACVSEPLMVVPACCALPAQHPLSAKPVITPEDLADQSFVSFRPDNPFRSEVDNLFAGRGIERIMRYEGRTTESICSMVAAGMGVSLVGPLGLDGTPRHDGIVIRPFEPAPAVEISLIRSRHRPLAAMAQAFITVLESRLKQNA